MNDTLFVFIYNAALVFILNAGQHCTSTVGPAHRSRVDAPLTSKHKPDCTPVIEPLAFTFHC